LIDFQNYDYGDAPLSPMYKPFFDVSEMSDWNLAHVNAYKTKVGFKLYSYKNEFWSFN